MFAADGSFCMPHSRSVKRTSSSAEDSCTLNLNSKRPAIYCRNRIQVNKQLKELPEVPEKFQKNVQPLSHFTALSSLTRCSETWAWQNWKSIGILHRSQKSCAKSSTIHMSERRHSEFQISSRAKTHCVEQIVND